MEAAAVTAEAASASIQGEEWLQPLQVFLSVFFFSFAASFLALSLLLKLLRWRPWCGCPVCYTYTTGAWAAEFPNLCDWYAHLLRQSPTRTVCIHVLGCVVTANPANVEHMLRTRFDNYPKGRAFSAILGDLLGRGIFNVDGECWRFQRKVASLELGSTHVRSFALRVFSSEVRERLLPLLASASASGGVRLDLQDVFRRFSFDTICRVSFGVDPGCLELSLPVSEFSAAFDKASRLSAGRATVSSPIVWKLKRLLNVGSERELRRCVRLIDDLAGEVIRQKRKSLGQESQDLLSRFMASIPDEKYLRDIVVSFLLAGRDTVASTLSCFFLLLSDHPEVEAAILEEAARVMGDAAVPGGSSIPTYDQLREMHYVHAALFESMRLYPAVQFDSKFAVDDDVLPDGTFVGRGTRVTYHPYAMGRMEEAWGSDCLQFRPRRWLTEEGTFLPESPYKYPVFQGGTRVCLGKEMAVLEMKCVVVAVVRAFRLRSLLPDGAPPKFAPSLTATLSGGLPVRVARRRDRE
ncbi:hypothetical protein Taro_043997 [Colocasia esculenta]|uniref:Cytochrome P450 94C1 n=1 Tax=Colocasia esculenta TaxID=4460 RepID=A0A843WMI3_COLES|nr:hypothetical protein [Colocasia esculenta]